MKYLIFTLIFLLPLVSKSQTLAEKLGYSKTDRLLIVNCDDVGMCHAANLAAEEGMTKGNITSGSVMVPCPWFLEIVDRAKENPNLDLGVHLTQTAEWQYYRWGPVASSEKVKGLIDKQGYLCRSIEEIYQFATPEEALIESRAQIQKALDAGIPVTHIDSHMGTMQLHPEYAKMYLQLAVEFNLPVRMASPSTAEKMGQPNIRNEFAETGIVFTDYFIYEELQQYGDDVEGFWKEIIKNLKPGVTELFIHASVPGEEIQSITNSWKTRNAEYETFVHDKEIAQLLKDENIILIGYKPLFDLQRSGAKK